MKMDPDAAINMEGLPTRIQLKHKVPDACAKSNCIICQRHKHKCAISSTERGMKRVREAAEVRQDEVLKRLHALDDNDTFYYHVDNECYKMYTLKKCLDNIQEIKSKRICMDMRSSIETQQEESSQSFMSLRSNVTTRNESSPKQSSYELYCIVCNCIRTTVGGEKVKKKFRICEEQRANQFLLASSYFKDDVFQRIADIDSEERIFAADLFAHGNCMKKYLLKYQRSVQPTKQSHTSPKFQVFQRISNVLKTLLEDGYGFTLSDIRDLMKNVDRHIDIRNNEVKIFLVRTYQDTIRFCPPKQKNEPLLVFSASISPEDLASKLRSIDAVRNAGEILRKELLHVDFHLDDKFCDAKELQKSWENTEIPDVLLNFFSSLFQISKSQMLQVETSPTGIVDDEDNDGSDDTFNGTASKVKQHAMQLSCLFQIIYYKLHNGSKKTPLHMMTGHSIYDRCKSKELITSMNRVGVSISYSEVLRARNLLAAYTVESCKDSNGLTPIPSHFNSSGFTLAALDNFDFEDNSSLSGTSGTHHTAMVLFQDSAGEAAPGKPNVSSTNLNNKTCKLKGMLPCQVMKNHMKPKTTPKLSNTFQTAEVMGVRLNHTEFPSANNTEFLITLTRSETEEFEYVPTWGGFHALITPNKLPLYHVGFLPVIPSPVTSYGTVFTALKNFDDVRVQLSQPVMPVFCDEGVFHTVADIVLHMPEEFQHLYPMMGMFHFTKVALRCTGRYITGSGLDDALIETEIFGIKTVKTVLNGSHYTRSLQGLLLLSDTIQALKLKAFWAMNNYNEYSGIAESLRELREALKSKNAQKCQELFNSLLHSETYKKLRIAIDVFDAEQCEKSELCKYFSLFVRMVSLVKNLVTADREGNWNLHVETVSQIVAIFHVFNCVHYQRYGAWYLERIKKLEVDNPFLYEKFMKGHFVVRDKEGKFNSVAPDMKLEQTIQRSKKSSKGIVGQTRKSNYVAEWELIYHEILTISNLFRELTNAKVMDHAEVFHHELTREKGSFIHENMKKLLNFMVEKGNPYDVVCHTPLCNFVTKVCVPERDKMSMLNIFEEGSKCYSEFQNERFILKTKKLNDRIPRMKTPCFQLSTGHKASPKKVGTTSRQIAQAQKAVDIARDRGESLKDILTYDLLPTNKLFENNQTTKPDKHTLILELEKSLSSDDYDFQRTSESMKTAVIVDFMSQVRMQKLSPEKTFGDIITAVVQNSTKVCSVHELHIIFDSYIEQSVKEGERLRRADNTGTVELASIRTDTRVPVQISKFWASCENKTKLQELARNLLSDLSKAVEIPIIASGVVIDKQIINAYMHFNNEKCEIKELGSSIEEADCRIIPHANWAIEHGAKRLVILSNDTDVVTLLLRYITVFHEKGVAEIWVTFGAGEKKRFIPIHHLLIRLGPELCRVIIKAHILTGDDVLSKIGSKKSAIKSDPTTYLEQFGETDELTQEDVLKVEKYLLRVWSRNTAAESFDELRFITYTQKTNSLDMLPPTSNSIQGHIQRAFVVTRNSVTLLSAKYSTLNPVGNGWEEEDGHLIPAKCLQMVPEDIVMVCGCKTCSFSGCGCKRVGLLCTEFCKCQDKCENS